MVRRNEENALYPVTARRPRTSKRQKAEAVLLSVWHCMLAEFAVKAEKEVLDSMFFQKEMRFLYSKIHVIGLAIHYGGDDDDEREYSKIEIEDMVSFAKSIRTIANEESLRPKEEWHREVGFLLQELADMEAQLKQHKDDITRGDIRRDIVATMEHQEPRHIACVITLWYWIAIWSVKEGPGGRAKEHFIESVETYSTSTLPTLLFSMDPWLLDNKIDDVEYIFSKLLIMLATSPDHWINVLRHFTENLVEAAHTIGTIHTKLLTDREDDDDNNNNNNITEDGDHDNDDNDDDDDDDHNNNNNNNNDGSKTRPLLKALIMTKSGNINNNNNKRKRKRNNNQNKKKKKNNELRRAQDLVQEEAETRGSCKPTFKKMISVAPVAQPVDSFKSVLTDTWHSVEKLGQDAAGVVGGVVQVVDKGESVIEDVKHLGHTIGRGLVNLFHRIF